MTLKRGIVTLSGMGRPHRAAEGGYVYHVLNRAHARVRTFDNDADYEAFEKVLAEAVEWTETRLLAYCILPNHWHLLVWPQKDGELSRFVGWLTLTHTLRAPTWPMPRTASWVDHVNAPQTEAELQALRRCVKRGMPYGDEPWIDRAVRDLGLESTLRPQGRPKKHNIGS